MVVDFAPHGHEFLREQHAHRRLGFTGEEIESFMKEAGLEIMERRDLPAGPGKGDQLTVSLWVGRDPRRISDEFNRLAREIA